MTTGDIATWIIALIIFIAFVFGMKRIYHNFSSGKCDSCGSGSSCSREINCHFVYKLISGMVRMRFVAL